MRSSWWCWIQPAADLHCNCHSFDTPDCVYDVAWSEAHSSHLIGASGDGSISLFDLADDVTKPARAWKEHQKEVLGVDWNVTCA